MRQSLRYLLFAAGTVVSALAMALVHGVARPASLVSVYIDVVIVLYWLLVAALLLRRRRPDPPDGEGAGSGPRPAVRFSVTGEPLARPRGSGRHPH